MYLKWDSITPFFDSCERLFNKSKVEKTYFDPVGNMYPYSLILGVGLSFGVF